MAKAQTFGDKMKKKKDVNKTIVKVIKGFSSDEGTVKFIEQFIALEDINQVDKIDINR